MSKRLIITISVSAVIVLIIYGFFTAFDPQYTTAEIKQKIGGTLICKSVYNSDIHSWQYNVNYTYKTNNGHLYYIGDGTYYGREWNKDEQLVKYGKWLILKTGNWIGSDKIIIGDLKTQKWKDYEFDPDNIEKDSIWLKSKTFSLLDYSPSQALIDKIDGGEVRLLYNFRVDQTNTTSLKSKEITYRIDSITGKPNMISVR